MTAEETRKMPAPVYAAWGAGDLAYQQLRKLPARVAELRDKVSTGEVDLKADVARLRRAARQNAKLVRAGAQQAQHRAAALYTDLVSRGEQVARGARSPLKVKATVDVRPTSEVGADAETRAARKTRTTTPQK